MKLSERESGVGENIDGRDTGRSVGNSVVDPDGVANR